MKLPCNVVGDLLPIYYDGLCSDESVTLIEEHLTECQQCKGLLDALRTEIENPIDKIDDVKPLKKIQKKFKQTRLRWRVTVLAILALIPVAFLGWNEYSAQGVAYSNQDELACGNAFMTCLTEGNYSKAYTYLDIEAKKHQWLIDWFEENDLVNMEEDGLKMFCKLGEKFEAVGGVDTFEYVGTSASYGVDYRGDKVHQITYRIKYAGKDQLFLVNVSQNGISGLVGADGLLDDPLGQLCIWGEFLWQDYKGCYYDYDLKKYVYYEELE